MEIAIKKYLLKYRQSKLNQNVREFLSAVKFSTTTIFDFPSIIRYRGETFKQIYILGNQALPLVIFATMFVSMVLSLEWGKKLEPFGAKLMVGRLVAISIIREIGPLVVGLMMAARIGAKIVSEIGNMVISNQVDALQAFGTDPIRRLIVPRVFAAFFVMTPLTIIGDVMGIIAGSFSSVTLLNVDQEFFWLSVRNGLVLKDLIIGIIKPPFFGILIGLISAYFAFNIKGGAEGMGQAATKTAMYTAMSVLVMDFILTVIVLSFY